MNPLIFWAQRIVLFLKILNERFLLQIVLKEGSLYFNTIISEELLA